jgi:hypothetical protein
LTEESRRGVKKKNQCNSVGGVQECHSLRSGWCTEQKKRCREKRHFGVSCLGIQNWRVFFSDDESKARNDGDERGDEPQPCDAQYTIQDLGVESLILAQCPRTKRSVAQNEAETGKSKIGQGSKPNWKWPFTTRG